MLMAEDQATGTREHVRRDLAVIGCGPVGLYAAYYAGFRGLTTVLIDSLPEAGGQVTALYPEKLIYDVGGLPSVRGRDLVARLVEQASRFHPTYLLGHSAQTLTSGDDMIEIRTAQGAAVRVRAVIIAGGIGTFTPRPLPIGQEWLGRGLTFFVPELAAHEGQDVVIVGGGDSACDWALSLEPIARSVILVHRRPVFRAHAYTVQQLRESTVEVVTEAEVTKLIGFDSLVGVEVTHKQGDVTDRPAQAVIAALGFTANLGPIREWGIGVTGNRYVPVDTTMATNVPAVYAAGDITDYPGKVRLISVGMGEAATAVNNAAVLINPAEQLFPGHSSDTPTVTV